MTRSYRLGRRGEAAEETRRRIVEATYQLHAEQGISATSMKEIAERAGVSVGTVYHHFPSYEDAIRACGTHTLALARPPEDTIFAGAETANERVRRFLRAYFEFYRRLPNYEVVAAERGKYPPLAEFFAATEARRRELAARAVGANATDDERVALLVAFADHGVFRALTAAGLAIDEAADRVAGVFNAWLTGAPAAHG